MNLHAKNPTNLIFIAIKNANLFSKFKMLKLRRGIQRVKRVSLYKKDSPTSKTKESTFLFTINEDFTLWNVRLAWVA